MIAIFQSCLLRKMRLSVVLEDRFTGYLVPINILEPLISSSTEQLTVGTHCFKFLMQAMTGFLKYKYEFQVYKQ
jgi:hypothetical protein